MAKGEKQQQDLPVSSEPELGLAKMGDSALAAAVSKTASQVKVHGDEETEQSALSYVTLRQKDLVENGATLRRAGGFRVGKSREPKGEDRDEITVTILAFRDGRVYFKSLKDDQPTCKSDDGIVGSRAAEVVDGNKVFGRCSECWYNQWGTSVGGGRGKRCKEQRRVLAFDWGLERPVVLTVGVSSLSAWAEYVSEFERALASFRDKESGRMPFLHMLFMVKLTPVYKAQPAPHYAIAFGKPAALPEDIQQRMLEQREGAKDQLGRAVAAQQHEAGDVIGEDEQPPF